MRRLINLLNSGCLTLAVSGVLLSISCVQADASSNSSDANRIRRYHGASLYTLKFKDLDTEGKPLIAQRPVRFSDVSSSHWASEYIERLAERGIITGYQGQFRPDETMTRAEFAALLSKTFSRSSIREPLNFSDVSQNYWAFEAIREANVSGFLSGYGNGRFQPNQNIQKFEILVSLVSGLGYTPDGTPNEIISFYRDVDEIPEWATEKITAATEQQVVVNYPNVQELNPFQLATRAEVAAMVYQALASLGEVPQITSSYVPVSVESLVNLDSDDPKVRAEAAAQLADLGNAALPAIPKLLELIEKEQDVTVLMAAVEAIGEIYKIPKKNEDSGRLAAMFGVPRVDDIASAYIRQQPYFQEAQAALINVLTNSTSDSVRCKTLLAMSNLKTLDDLSSETKTTVVTDLISNLQNENSETINSQCDEAIYLLGQFGFEATPAVPVLTEKLEQTDDSQEKLEIIKTLILIGPTSQAALPELISIISNPADELLNRVSAFHFAKQLGIANQNSLPLPHPHIGFSYSSEDSINTSSEALFRDLFDLLHDSSIEPQRKSDILLILSDISSRYDYFIDYEGSTLHETASNFSSDYGRAVAKAYDELLIVASNENESFEIRYDTLIAAIDVYLGSANPYVENIPQIEEASYQNLLEATQKLVDDLKQSVTERASVADYIEACAVLDDLILTGSRLVSSDDDIDRILKSALNPNSYDSHNTYCKEFSEVFDLSNYYKSELSDLSKISKDDLVAILRDNDSSEFDQIKAILALGYMAPDTEMIRTFADLLNHESLNVRTSAANHIRVYDMSSAVLVPDIKDRLENSGFLDLARHIELVSENYTDDSEWSEWYWPRRNLPNFYRNHSIEQLIDELTESLKPQHHNIHRRVIVKEIARRGSEASDAIPLLLKIVRSEIDIEVSEVGDRPRQRLRLEAALAIREVDPEFANSAIVELPQEVIQADVFVRPAIGDNGWIRWFFKR